jgi:outer membrane protein TolC
MKRYRLSLLFVLALLGVKAQEADTMVISIEDAVALTLEKNFDIQVSQKNAEVASNNNQLGNANYLPTVSTNASYNYAIDNTDIEFASPAQDPINATGAVTETINASVNLNYNVFSGGSRNYTMQRLRALDYQGQLQLRQSMEQAVMTAIVQFLDAANQYQTLELNQKAVEISLDRFRRARENYEYGVFGKLELLNAEVDLRNDSTSLFQTRLAYEKSLKTLVNSMGLDPANAYRISPAFSVEEELQLDQLMDEALSSNANYLVNRNAITTSEMDLKLSKSQWLPRLDLSAAYSYNNQSFDANFIRTNQSNGFNGGITLSYDLFNGNNRKRQEQNARLQLESQQATLQKTEYQLKSSILNTYNDFQTSLELIALTRRNIEAAEANYERSQEAFSAGQITGIQLREAQLNLLNSLNQLEVQRIQAKVAEVNLHFYAGMLVSTGE